MGILSWCGCTGGLNRQSLNYWCSNERNWLLALESLIMLCGVALALLSIFFVINSAVVDVSELAEDEEAQDSRLYDLWIGLSVVSLVQVIVAIVGIIGAARVSLYTMLANFWMTALVLGALLVLAIAAIDFQDSFAAWLQVNWDSNSNLEQARKTFCAAGTYDNLCQVPRYGFPYDNATIWCMENYNGFTNCTDIRNEALNDATNFITVWMGIVAALSLSSVLEMTVAMVLTVRLVTVPIIMRSMQSGINYLMFFPILASFVTGLLLEKYSDMYTGFAWVLTVYYVVGSMLFICAVLGIFAGHLQHYKLLRVYMALLAFVLLAYIVLVFVMCSLLVALGTDFANKSSDELNRITCDSGFDNCCCCQVDGSINQIYPAPSCPEWSSREVYDVGAVFVKIGIITSLLCVAFVVAALVTALVTRNHLKGYEEEYI